MLLLRMWVLCTCNNALFRCKDVSFNSRRDNGHIKGGRRPSKVLRRSSLCEMALGWRKASPVGRIWLQRWGGSPNCTLPWRRMFLTQNVMFDSCLLAFDKSATGGVQLHRDLRHGEEFFTTSTTTRATATLFISGHKNWRWSVNNVQY